MTMLEMKNSAGLVERIFKVDAKVKIEEDVALNKVM